MVMLSYGLKLSQTIILFLLRTCLIKADLEYGQCPQLKSSPGLNEIKSTDDCASLSIYHHELLQMTYAFLPASREYKRISAFSFDFQEDGGIETLQAVFACSSFTGDIDISLTIAQDGNLFSKGFNFINGRAFPYWFYESGNRLCKDWLKQPDYTYKLVYHPGKYFLVWGCAQVNQTIHDRGLWMMGPHAVPNVSALFDEMLRETGLDFSTRKNILWGNKNYSYIYPHKPEVDPFYFRDCYTGKIDEETKNFEIGNAARSYVDYKNKQDKMYVASVAAGLVLFLLCIGGLMCAIKKSEMCCARRTEPLNVST